MSINRTGNSSKELSTYLVVAILVFVCVLIGLSVVWKAMNRRMDAVQTYGLPAATDQNAAFVEAWSVQLNPPLTHEMALNPGHAGEFFALNHDQIYRFDASGAQQDRFAAPPKSTRIATDPTGAVPYLLVVSSNTKWTGAIDYVVTTDYFLHALDMRGRQVWKQRFDPNDLSALEPVIANLHATPVIVLSASRRILCFDVNGRQLWDTAFWHHPGTLAVADLDGDGNGDLLAAQAPKREIVRIDALGQIVGPWGEGDGPSRLRVARMTPGEIAAVSLRQVFGRGPGVRHALAFFDGKGAMIGETELPQDVAPLSYSPIAAMDVDGTGRKNWVIAFGDGSIQVFSPRGEQLTRHHTGVRLRTFLAVPQPNGPDLLVTATHRGLTAWRPVAAHMAVK